MESSFKVACACLPPPPSKPICNEKVGFYQKVDNCNENWLVNKDSEARNVLGERKRE